MKSNYKENVGTVLGELSEVLNSIDENKIKEIADAIVSGGKIIGFSAGRMGLALRAFIMRLNHLGYDAFYIGDTYVPPMKEGDVLICCSNSGTTSTVANIVDIVRKKAPKAKIVSLTGNADSYIAKNSDITATFKTCNGGLNSADNPDKLTSIQPMTTVTEQAMLIAFDLIALQIIDDNEIDIAETKRYHSNIE